MPAHGAETRSRNLLLPIDGAALNLAWAEERKEEAKMPEVTSYAQGTPCWIDLATTDLDGAEKFYERLFGWESNRQDMGEGGWYSMQLLKGKDAAAIYTLSQEMRAQGIPPHWATYIAVDDADKAAKRVEVAGGTVVVGPMDVYESGRMVVAADSTGAHVMLWQARNHIGSRIVNEHGALVWNELLTDDAEKAASFYREVLDIGIERMQGPFDYTLFKVGGRSVAGIMQKTPEMAEIPNVWTIYFHVDDCDAAVETTNRLGGEVEMGPRATEMGPFAVLADPQGAYFNVIASTSPGA
jgi:predicted enzyme related to lactoylglutathione lyase